MAPALGLRDVQEKPKKRQTQAIPQPWMPLDDVEPKSKSTNRGSKRSSRDSGNSDDGRERRGSGNPGGRGGGGPRGSRGSGRGSGSGDIGESETSASSSQQSSRLPRVKRERLEDAEEEEAVDAIGLRQRIVVGLDFGTTHSGVAFASTIDGRRSGTKLIVNWPTGWGPEHKEMKNITWGYAVQSGMNFYTWFKILLDEEADVTGHDDPHLFDAVGTNLLGLPEGKSALAVVTDFLKCLRKHIFRELSRPLTEEILKVTPIDFYVTVPATWIESAKARTIQAAKKAGLLRKDKDRLILIPEPEAAIVAGLTASRQELGFPLQLGDVILSADLGGGTNDFQVVKIKKLEPLQLKDVVVGQGGKKGSTTIDRNFWALIVERYGECFTSINRAKTGPGSVFMEEFETAKRSFTMDNEDEIFRIGLPSLRGKLMDAGRDDDDFDFEECQVKLTGADMEKLFQTTMDDVCQHTNALWQKTKMETGSPFKIIVMAGGSSTSEYIFEKYRHFCNEKFAGKVKVIRPPDAWSAIATGACQIGLQNSVMVSRKARSHYGMEVHRAFREGEDDEARAFICPHQGKRCRGAWHSILKIGDQVTASTKREILIYVIVQGDNEDDLSFTHNIFESRDENVPEYIDDDGVHPVANFSFDVEEAFAREMRKKQRLNEGSADADVKLDIKLVVSPGSDKGLVEMIAFANRMRVGNATINYGVMAGDANM